MIKKERKTKESKKNTIPRITKDQVITYKSVELLEKFTDDYGRILPRLETRLTIKNQKKIAKVIKRARILNLLAFVKEGQT